MSLTAPQCGHGMRCNAPPQTLQNFAPAGLQWSQNRHPLKDIERIFEQL
jgi:hypothetical protein